MYKSIPTWICQDQLLSTAGTLHTVAFCCHSNRLYLCSAGIGRSGVFIAADIAIQQLDQEEEIDILQILSSLRQDRGGMVQTNEQYVFLHKVQKYGYGK